MKKFKFITFIMLYLVGSQYLIFADNLCFKGHSITYQHFDVNQKGFFSNGSISTSTKIGSVTSNPFYSVINIVRSIKSWRKNKKETKQFLQKYRNWDQQDFASYFYKLHKKDIPDIDNPIFGQYKGEPKEFPGQVQQSILSEYQWYQFYGFRQYVKQFPLYESFIAKLHKELRSNEYFLEDTKALPGYKHTSFKQTICDLHKEIVRKQKQTTLPQIKQRPPLISPRFCEQKLKNV